MNKNFYNQSSATQLGWDPSWFREKYFDDKLVRAIKKWQKIHGLKADGLCGPGTFRRIWTQRQSDIDEFKWGNPQYSNYVVYNGNFIPIKWDKVILWSERNGLAARPGSYYDYSSRPKRNVRLLVNHWDVCLSAESCTRVLNKRGISVHFCLDNDGTIYQILDTQHSAWHCSSRLGNQNSIGIEISNAYYPKYQDWYVKNGFGERPIVKGATVHGHKLPDFTGFYPVQIEALKQVNTRLKQEIKKGVDQKAKKIANESASELTNALYNRLAVSIDEPCPFCKIVEQSECQNNSGEIVVYTKVELKTENYLNRDLRNRLDTLLEDSDKLLEELKEF